MKQSKKNTYWRRNKESNIKRYKNCPKFHGKNCVKFPEKKHPFVCPIRNKYLINWNYIVL